MNTMARFNNAEWVSGSIVRLVVQSGTVNGMTKDIMDVLNKNNAGGFLNKTGNALSLPKKQFGPIFETCMSSLNNHLSAQNEGTLPSKECIELLATCVINCSTLQEIILMTIRCMRNMKDHTSTFSAYTDDKRAMFSIDNDRKTQTKPALVSDVFNLCFFYKFFSWFIMEPLRNARAGFVHAPLITPALGTEILGIDVDFKRDANFVLFDKDTLNLPNMRTYEDLKLLLQDIPIELMTLQNKTNARVRVETLIRKYVNNGQAVPNVDLIATMLGHSGPTLRRHLMQEQTSFQTVHDRIRKERAIELLATTDYSIDEISGQLGFSAASGFSRAFKDWTGLPPSSYRNENLGRAVVS
jgi:AraC-like DNA-binding protein